MRLRTVQNLQEVIHNIIHFNGEFGRDHRVAPRLALFRHWYYVPQFDLFGAEKYIGHVGEQGEQIAPLSVADYLEHADALDNLDPQPTLREWFRPATEEEDFRLRLELAYILSRQGREPNDVIRMFVMKESG